MGEWIAVFRLKVRLLGRHYGFLPPWTQAEIDEIRNAARVRAEQFARWAS